MTPRLGVVLERTSQYRSFLRSPFNFDKEKQNATAILFTESLPGADLRAMFGLQPRLLQAGVRAGEIFVYFVDFERVAKWEVHDRASWRRTKRIRGQPGYRRSVLVHPAIRGPADSVRPDR